MMTLVASLMLLVSACSTGKSVKRTHEAKVRPIKPVTPRAITPDNQRKYNTFFLEAIRQKEKGADDAVFELLSHALKLNPDAPEALFEMAQLYKRRFPTRIAEIQSLHERAAALDTANTFYAEQLADLYLRIDSVDAAKVIYEDMAERFTNDSEILMMLLGIYESTEDFKSMISVLDRMEQREGKSEAISREKYKIYLQLKDEQNAFKEINDLCAEYPNDARYRLLAADLHLQMERPDSAYAIYREVLGKEPDNAMARLALMGYYGNTNQDSLYYREVDSIVLNPNIETAVRAEAIKSLIRTSERKGGDSLQVITLFKKAVLLPQENRLLPDLFQAYMILKHVPNDSIVPVWKQILTIEPEYDAARLQLLQYYISKKQISEAVRLCQEGVQYDPTRLVYYFYGGASLYQSNRNDEALKLLEKGCNYVDEEDDPKGGSDIYALIADIYHDNGQKEKAYTAYQKAIDLNSENLLCLNNYAYYLSLDGKDLDKAAELSYKTIQADPANPTYLDTYAWILFMQGKYTEAKIYIDETLKHLDETAENAGIIEHAGDIYIRLGHTQEAVSFWQRALKLGSESATLKKKINRKKYIAP